MWSEANNRTRQLIASLLILVSCLTIVLPLAFGITSIPAHALLHRYTAHYQCSCWLGHTRAHRDPGFYNNASGSPCHTAIKRRAVRLGLPPQVNCGLEECSSGLCCAPAPCPLLSALATPHFERGPPVFL